MAEHSGEERRGQTKVVVDKILRDGAEKARPLARATLDRARRACGVGGALAVYSARKATRSLR